MDVVEIGNIIRERREQLGLKQEDLAEMAGVSARTIYLAESGQGNPSLETLTKLTMVLGLEIKINIKSIE